MNKSNSWCWWLLMSMLTSQFVIAEGAGNAKVFLNLPFQLVQQYGSSCMQVESKEAELDSCIYVDPVSGLCLSRNRAVMKSCVKGAEEQNWYYDHELKHLHLSGYSGALCLTRMVRSVEMLPCKKEGSVAQQWFFNEEGLLKSIADTRESGSYLYAVENQELTLFHLKYQFTVPDLGSGQCYTHPVTRVLVCTEGEKTAEEETDQGDEDSAGGGGDNHQNSGSNDGAGENNANDQEPPKKPRPKYWLSRRLTPLLSLQMTGERCLSLMMPDSCSPAPDDETSQACLEGVSVNVTDCSASNVQKWQHDLQTKKIYNKLSGYGLCLTLKKNGLFMEGCFVNAEDSQRWYFSRGGKGSYGQKGMLRTMVNGLKTPYLYIRRIDLPAGMAAETGRLKYKIAPSQPEGCFYHPVTGAALGVACK